MLFGIDFGTSNTCISYYSRNRNKIECLTDEFGKNLIPTCIYLDDHELFFGTTALEKGGVCFFKNTLEKKYCIPFLMSIKKLIESTFIDTNSNTKIIECIISVPVDWDFIKTETLKSYFTQVGFQLNGVLLEPVAAALVEKENDTQTEDYVIVVDCGGGTTDLSLVNIDSSLNYYEVLNVLGDSNLGGEDLTNSLIHYLKFDSLKNQKEVRLACQLAKENLSREYQSTIYLESQDKRIHISRSRFEIINIDWCNKFRNLLLRFKEQIYMYENQITKIILIGGGSKCYLVEKLCKNCFPKYNITMTENPQMAVSKGCLLKGLSEKDKTTDIDTDITIINVCPDTIGVEIQGGVFVPIVSKNNLLPISRTMVFTNSTEDDSIDIHIYKGDRKFVQDNHYISTLILRDIPKVKPGTLKITITISIDQNLNVSFLAQTDTGQNLRQAIEKKLITQQQENYCEYTQFLKKLQDLE